MLQAACEPFIDAEAVTCDCEVDEEVVEELIDQASDILTIMSGGQVSGRCTDVVRPRREGGPVCGWWRFGPGRRHCSCGDIEGITLRGPDPDDIVIMLDGAVFTDFKVVDGRLLVRTDGHGWPGCQDILAANTESGTFEITYKYGLAPNLLAQAAANEIVCSFLKSNPNKPQAHPGVRGVSIAGVMITIEQQIAEIKRKTFLMPNVVRFLTVYAPDGPTPAVIYSPELEDGWKLHRVT